MSDDKKIIFSMVGVGKVIPPNRQILKNIYLSFFYGAKIGIIGLNGSGKSTLLRIIAGTETSFNGEVVFSKGYSVGLLEQEPDILLLDEPTNDIDINTLRALEEGLENFAGCAVVISHDRWFLDRIATHILAFEGDSQVYYFEGGYSDYEENKKKRLGNTGPKRIRYKKLK